MRMLSSDQSAKTWFVFFAGVLLAFAGLNAAAGTRASASLQTTASGTLDEWWTWQSAEARRRLFMNISPRGTLPGTVVASPSRAHPDYYYNWVRDAALVMHTVYGFFAEAKGAGKSMLLSSLLDYAQLNQTLQDAPNRSGGLGEPKFEVDGTAYAGNWSRPQNDGPALRAITLSALAQDLLQQPGGAQLVERRLYAAALPAYSLVKRDLEFVAQHWREPSYDLWEEVRGDHFYTLMAQRRALVDGARLADALTDPGAARWYRTQAQFIERGIEAHWNVNAQRIEPTLNRVEGVDWKYSGVDVAVILAVLHTQGDDDYFGVADVRVQKAAVDTENAFRNLYAINRSGGGSNDPTLGAATGVAIGRYPEDRYDGYDVRTTDAGNPWVLSTLAMAEYYYRLAARAQNAGAPLRAQDLIPTLRAGLGAGAELATDLAASLRAKGDAFARRVQRHAAHDGSLAEQMNRDSGYMQGAPDLTWSYASVLSAARARHACEGVTSTLTSTGLADVAATATRATSAATL